jgi:hypothetical protein
MFLILDWISVVLRNTSGGCDVTSDPGVNLGALHPWSPFGEVVRLLQTGRPIEDPSARLVLDGRSESEPIDDGDDQTPDIR